MLRVKEIFYEKYKQNPKEWNYLFQQNKKDVFREKEVNDNANSFNYKNVDEWMRDALAFLKNDPNYYERIFIYYDNKGEIIGSTYFYPRSFSKGIGTYSVDVDEKQKGKGYGFQMMKQFLDFIFDKEPWLKKLYGDVLLDNQPSLAMHKKLISIPSNKYYTKEYIKGKKHYFEFYNKKNKDSSMINFSEIKNKWIKVFITNYPCDQKGLQTIGMVAPHYLPLIWEPDQNNEYNFSKKSVNVYIPKTITQNRNIRNSLIGAGIGTLAGELKYRKDKRLNPLGTNISRGKYLTSGALLGGGAGYGLSKMTEGSFLKNTAIDAVNRVHNKNNLLTKDDINNIKKEVNEKYDNLIKQNNETVKELLNDAKNHLEEAKRNNNQKNIEFWENQIKNYEKALNNNFSDEYIKVDSKTKNDLINSLQRTINNAKKDLEEAKKINNLKRIKELTDTINFYQNSINQLNFSLKSTLIGGGIGTLAGLTYGYWDYNDEKKQARIKGIEAPNKKKILIRDTLIGLGIGSGGGALADIISNKLSSLFDKKDSVSKEKKELFDSIQKNILLGSDKKKLLTLVEINKNKLDKDQYEALKQLASSTSSQSKNSGGDYKMAYYKNIEQNLTKMNVNDAKSFLKQHRNNITDKKILQYFEELVQNRENNKSITDHNNEVNNIAESILRTPLGEQRRNRLTKLEKNSPELYKEVEARLKYLGGYSDSIKEIFKNPVQDPPEENKQLKPEDIQHKF